ncbi:hypothetical protein BDR03DRAFT_957921 [Suillus americanus]|nr:hypothetical protein BDR03DRAFT_957921 [Suillus americanus]
MEANTEPGLLLDLFSRPADLVRTTPNQNHMSIPYTLAVTLGNTAILHSFIYTPYRIRHGTRVAAWRLPPPNCKFR